MMKKYRFRRKINTEDSKIVKRELCCVTDKCGAACWIPYALRGLESKERSLDKWIGLCIQKKQGMHLRLYTNTKMCLSRHKNYMIETLLWVPLYIYIYIYIHTQDTRTYIHIFIVIQETGYAVGYYLYNIYF